MDFFDEMCYNNIKLVKMNKGKNMLNGVMELFELIKSFSSKKEAKIVIIMLCLGAVLFSFISSEYYINHYKIPNWDYISENGDDIFEANIPLKTGYIIVTPQLVVKYDEKVVFIVDILAYYDINAVELSENAKEKTFYFKLTATEEQQNVYKQCIDEIKKAIIDGINDSEKITKIKFEEAKLVKLESQNKESNIQRCQYLYITDSLEREIQEREAELRRTKYSIDLDVYKEDGLSDNHVIKVIESCVSKIKLQE